MYEWLNVAQNNVGIDGVVEVSKASWLLTTQTIYLGKNELTESGIVWLWVKCIK